MMNSNGSIDVSLADFCHVDMLLVDGPYFKSTLFVIVLSFEWF